MENAYEVEVVIGADSRTQKRETLTVKANSQVAAIAIAVQAFDIPAKFDEFEPMYIRCVIKKGA